MIGSQQKKPGMIMTQGSIPKQILLFSIPLLIGSLIQQLYSTTDLIFVGNVLGKEAAAAIGASGMIVTCIIGFFTGISVGVGVVTAQAIGRRDTDRVRAIVGSALTLALFFAVIFTIGGYASASVLLRVMAIPEHLFREALLYLRLYLLSLPAIVLYNVGVGMIRAAGDSKSPTLFQLFGGIANVIGDYLFIVVFPFGIRGVAIATICSQSVAAFFTLQYLIRMDRDHILRISDLGIRWEIARDIFRIGIPSAIQAIVISLSNLIVQARIDTLGVNEMAAFTIYYKIENIMYYPIMAIGQSVATFTGQNIGAGQPERAQKGVRTAVGIGLCVVAAIAVFSILYSEKILRIFTEDSTVIQMGQQMILVAFSMYFLYLFLEVLASAIRGAGKAMPVMLIILINLCILRTVFLEVMMYVNPTALGIIGIYPITWLLTVLCLFGYYRGKHSCFYGSKNEIPG